MAAGAFACGSPSGITSVNTVVDANSSVSRISVSKGTTATILRDIVAFTETGPSVSFAYSLEDLLAQYNHYGENGTDLGTVYFDYPDNGNCVYLNENGGTFGQGIALRVASEADLRLFSCDLVKRNVAALVANYQRRCQTASVLPFPEQLALQAMSPASENKILQLAVAAGADAKGLKFTELVKQHHDLIEARSALSRREALALYVGEPVTDDGVPTNPRAVKKLTAAILQFQDALNVKAEPLGMLLDVDSQRRSTKFAYMTDGYNIRVSGNGARVARAVARSHYTTVLYDSTREVALGGMAPLTSPDHEMQSLLVGIQEGERSAAFPATHYMYWDPDLISRKEFVETWFTGTEPGTDNVVPFWTSTISAPRNNGVVFVPFLSDPLETFLAKHSLTLDDLDPAVQKFIESDRAR